jgi:hypothetical protein
MVGMGQLQQYLAHLKLMVGAVAVVYLVVEPQGLEGLEEAGQVV